VVVTENLKFVDTKHNYLLVAFLYHKKARKCLNICRLKQLPLLHLQSLRTPGALIPTVAKQTPHAMPSPWSQWKVEKGKAAQ